MTRRRRALALIAGIWLSSQLAVMTVTPVAMWASGVDDYGAACTCTHGAAATCPMHHRPAAGLKICVMQSAGHEAGVMLSSLFSVAGLVPGSTPLPAPSPGLRVPMFPHTVATPVSVAPDPPPPRAVDSGN